VQRRVDHHPVADRTGRDRRADADHDTGHVHAGDVREAETGQQTGPVPLQHVEAVDGRGVHLDEDLPGAADRIGHRHRPQNLRATVFGVMDGSHVIPRTKGVPSARGPRWLLAKKVIAISASRYGEAINSCALISNPMAGSASRSASAAPNSRQPAMAPRSVQPPKMTAAITMKPRPAVMLVLNEPTTATER